MIFLHWAPWPLWAEYDGPERYGLARKLTHGASDQYGVDEVAHKTRNFRLNTSDGESLGVWHILCVIRLALVIDIVNWADVKTKIDL